MKKIGLIGGITWHSTLEYYRAINAQTAVRLGGSHSAVLALESIDFHEAIARTRNDRENGSYPLYLEAAQNLRRSNAEIFAICANTAHMYADKLASAVDMPLIHIADATAVAISEAGCSRVGLLGTRPTMEGTFIQDRLMNHGIEVITPDTQDRERLHQLIFTEMVSGIFSKEALEFVRQVCQSLYDNGAKGVILGCTELPILMRNQTVKIPLFDTTSLHASAIVDAACSMEDLHDT